MEPTQRDDQEPESPATPELSGKGAARRRIGLGVSGLILTLASRPGMANTPATYCGSVSGWNSASTASKTKTPNGKCMGLSAGYWIKDDHTWPNNIDRLANFSTLFPEGRGTLYADSSLIDTVTSNDNTKDPWNLRRELICAYLNAAAGFNTHPSTSELQAIWKNYVLNYPYYIVQSTGAKLSGEQLKFFLAASHDS